MMIGRRDLQNFLRRVFPVGQDVACAIAYGSGAFAQENAPATPNTMLDMVLVVDDPRAWHATNLKQNAHHYSLLGRCGAGVLANLPRQMGATVYYNTLVRAEGQLIKYGVVSRADAEADLRNWTHLYLAGRLHKPVHMIVNGDAAFEAALQVNLEHALSAALLCVPPTFIDTEMFMAVCQLSYLGDPRMGVAENPRKVQNIVNGNRQGFEALYRPLLVRRALSSPHVLQPLPGHSPETATSWRRGESLVALQTIADSLPPRVAERILASSCSRVVAAGQNPNWPTAELQATVADIVHAASARQTLLGLLSAGPLKALTYAYQKVAKRVTGR